MTSVKDVLAIVGAVTIIAVAGAAIGYGVFSGKPTDETEAADTSGVAAELNRYADILNDSSHYVCIYCNTGMFKSGSNNALPITGSVVVEGLSLSFDVWGDSMHTYKIHWVVPYHAISGLEIQEYAT